MTREEASRLLPLISAYAGGKRIQYREHEDDDWDDCEPEFCAPSECYRIAPEVGSAEWANALPEGTRIRHREWMSHTWFARKGACWYDKNGVHCLVRGDGWELYTPPAKKLRPWRPEEVPVGAQVRYIGNSSSARMLIVNSAERGLLGPDSVVPYQTLLSAFEHSLDHGKTWLPCGVEEEA